MQNKNVGYVYITTNNINGKKYIGKRSSPEFDNNYFGSGKLIKRAIKKYGKENFSCNVLRWCQTEDELNQYEKFYIAKFDAQKSNMFYNISSGGDWGDVTKGMSKEEYEEWKRKISPIGRHHSEETKAKMSAARKGIIFSPSTIEKMRKNNIGEKNNMYGTKWSEERKNKFSEIVSKPVKATLPNGEEISFGSVKACGDYFVKNYNVSKYIVKKLLRDKSPLNLPKREKNHYPNVFLLNGLKIQYLEKLQ